MDHRLKLSHMQKVGGKQKNLDSEYAEQCLCVMNMLICVLAVYIMLVMIVMFSVCGARRHVCVLHLLCVCSACVLYIGMYAMLYNAPSRHVCAHVPPPQGSRNLLEVRGLRWRGPPLKFEFRLEVGPRGVPPRAQSGKTVRPTVLIGGSATDCVDRRGAQVHLKLPQG